MNIYFLVEGKRTEKKIYPEWIKHLIPNLIQVQYHDQVEKNNYYLISGHGYPNILYDALDNAIDKITESGKYDYLVICVDADEETVDSRKSYINSFVAARDISLGNTKIEVIVQNRCIETWLLGNRKIFDSRQPSIPPLSEYVAYYDVSQDDPELMGNFNMNNYADFHHEYLKEIFRSKNITYSKKFPNDAKDKHYLEQLRKRIQDRPTDLKSFRFFLDFCERINNCII
jgi:RloB-like protein